MKKKYKPYTEVKPSKYQILDTDDGFRIIHTVRQKYVDIILSPNSIGCYVFKVIEGTKNPLQIPFSTEFSLFNFHGIIDWCASLLQNNLLDYTNFPQKTKAERGKFNGIQKWTKKKTGMAIAKKVAAKLKELHNKIDPDILLVNKKVFSVLGPTHYNKVDKLLTADFIKTNKFWVNDLKNYNAASVYLIKNYFYEEYSYSKKLEYKEVKSEHWMQLFKLDKIGEAKKHLVKTLMKASSLFILQRLTDVRFTRNFTRPIDNKFELFCLAVASQHHNFERHKKSLFDSNKKQWSKALKMILKNQHYELDLRKNKNLRVAISFMLDYDQDTNCKVTGLAERSIAWHKELMQNRVLRELKERSIKTAIPSVPFASNKIKFLEDVGQVIDEGNLMGHCVASYAKKAVRGDCYLFHVDYAGEMATAEVTKDGNISQIRGPHNKDNKASKWGRGILYKWAQKLKETKDNPILDNSVKLSKIVELIDEIPF